MHNRYISLFVQCLLFIKYKSTFSLQWTRYEWVKMTRVPQICNDGFSIKLEHLKTHFKEKNFAAKVTHFLTCFQMVMQYFLNSLLSKQFKPGNVPKLLTFSLMLLWFWTVSLATFIWGWNIELHTCLPLPNQSAGLGKQTVSTHVVLWTAPC